jgi:hypothetical protein
VGGVAITTMCTGNQTGARNGRGKAGGRSEIRVTQAPTAKRVAAMTSQPRAVEKEIPRHTTPRRGGAYRADLSSSQVMSLQRGVPQICGPRSKRLVHHTICFAKTMSMHDLVIGLFISRYEFGRPI